MIQTPTQAVSTIARFRARKWMPRLPLALALAVAVGVGTLGLPATALGWDTGTFSPASESQLFALTNQARASAGLRPLTLDSTLASLARWRSKDMGDRNYFSHNIPPSGEMVFDVMQQQGYCFKLAGENIGWDNADDATATTMIQQMFMNSTEHRDNILGATWDVMGIGAYQAADGKKIWTVLFADSCATAPKPTPKPTPKATPRPTATPVRVPTSTPTAAAHPTPSPVFHASPTPAQPVTTPEPSASPTPTPTPTPTETIAALPTPTAAPSGSPDGTPQQSLRVVDPPASGGLLQGIIGAIVGIFFGS